MDTDSHNRHLDGLAAEASDLFDEGRLDEAVTLYSQCIVEQPANPRLLLERGRVRVAQHDYEAATDDLDDAEQLGLVHPDIYRLRAQASYFGGFSHEFRLEDGDRLIQLQPDDPDGWFYRGDALSDLGDMHAAIEDFDQALKLDPTNSDIYFQRAKAWERLDEEERAEDDFQRSSQHDSTDPNAYHYKGHYYERRDMLEQALEEFNEAVRLDSGSFRHYNCRGNVMLALEDEGVTVDEIEDNFVTMERLKQGNDATMPQNRYEIFDIVQAHFDSVALDQLELTDRTFPYRTLPDVQVAFDGLENDGFSIIRFYATQHGNCPVQQFSELYVRDRRTPVIPGNPKFEEFDIGEEQAFRCLKHGVWLLQRDNVNLVVLLDTENGHSYTFRLEVAALRDDKGAQVTEQFFSWIETSIKRSQCYRGKTLSFETEDRYSGTSSGLHVHKLHRVEREHVILPSATLDLLDRNVISFVRRRDRLSDLGMAIKKGLLFYGPPGTGKTHTVQYLAQALKDHTTLLITGDQVGMLTEYMTLARLLEPCLVVIEDVDLIARHREELRGSAEEVMLNKLLNEMDGTKSDAQILFVLTTNRAAALEEALASRPGRIDQSIEFPLPDSKGRDKLVRLYAHGIPVNDDLVETVVTRTENVSASFIKELMRRAIQFALERDDEAETIELVDIEGALEELLVTGGALNKKLLGAIRPDVPTVGFRPPSDFSSD